jgi:hypothetical protein
MTPGALAQRPSLPLAIDRSHAHQVLGLTLEHFFPEATLDAIGAAADHRPLDMALAADAALTFNWFGARYRLARQPVFTVAERLLLDTIATVANDRLAAAASSATPNPRTNVVGGALEDRCVAAFIASSAGEMAGAHDDDFIGTLVSVIDMLRRTAAAALGSGRGTAGALVHVPRSRALDRADDERRGLIRYAWPLRGWKTLHELCDGMHTLAAVDAGGFVTAIVDLRSATRHSRGSLPYPVPKRYVAHARATLDGERICIVLNENGVMHVFVRGMQIFSFMHRRWRLRDAASKVTSLELAIGHRALARRLVLAAQNLSETRVRGLFLVVDHEHEDAALVSAGDRLDSSAASFSAAGPFHYLFRDTNVLEMSDALLQTAASIDGAIVLRKNGDLVAVGAALRGGEPEAAGAQAMTARAASRFGAALGIGSEGDISLFVDGSQQWTL